MLSYFKLIYSSDPSTGDNLHLDRQGIMNVEGLGGEKMDSAVRLFTFLLNVGF